MRLRRLTENLWRIKHITVPGTRIGPDPLSETGIITGAGNQFGIDISHIYVKTAGMGENFTGNVRTGNIKFPYSTVIILRHNRI